MKKNKVKILENKKKIYSNYYGGMIEITEVEHLDQIPDGAQYKYTDYDDEGYNSGWDYYSIEENGEWKVYRIYALMHIPLEEIAI